MGTILTENSCGQQDKQLPDYVQYTLQGFLFKGSRLMSWNIYYSNAHYNASCICIVLISSMMVKYRNLNKVFIHSILRKNEHHLISSYRDTTTKQICIHLLHLCFKWQRSTVSVCNGYFWIDGLARQAIIKDNTLWFLHSIIPGSTWNMHFIRRWTSWKYPIQLYIRK